MQTTTNRRAPLARCHQSRQGRMDPRIEWRRRKEAFVELFADAHPKPPELIAITRAEPRTKLYDERQREIIHAGIRAGLISRARIIRYRAQQLLDDFAQFPDEASPLDVTYVHAMLEQAEAIEAQTVAHAIPTEANRLTAYRETRESVAMQELLCVVLVPDGAQ